MDKMAPEGDVSEEPVQDQLLEGEDVAVKSHKILCRRGRSGVRVRVVGGSSLAWVEAAEDWGCAIEAVVVNSSCEISEVIPLVSKAVPTTVATAISLHPMSHWSGLLLSTV